jgi:hypothetical protein
MPFSILNNSTNYHSDPTKRAAHLLENFEDGSGNILLRRHTDTGGQTMLDYAEWTLEASLKNIPAE